MANYSANEITQLPQAWGEGDETAFDRLALPLVYGELHYLAKTLPAGANARA